MVRNFIIITIIIIILFYFLYINNDKNICKNNKLNNNLEYEVRQCSGIAFADDINFIDGIWVSDNEFNKLSGIDTILLYIDSNSEYSKLLISINNNIVINENLIFNISNIKYNKKKQNLKFIINFDSENNTDFIWNNINIKGKLNIKSGNLKLKHDDILYANLFKDNKMTYYLNNI